MRSIANLTCIVFICLSVKAIAQTGNPPSLNQQGITSCPCENKFHYSGNLLPTLVDFHNSNGLFDMTLIRLDPQTYGDLYYDNASTSEKENSFDIIAFRKVTIPFLYSDGIQIVLNPCLNKGSQFHYDVEYSGNSAAESTGFSYKTFQRKPREYFKALIKQYYHNSPVETMGLLKRLLVGDDAPLEKFMDSIIKHHRELKLINKPYKLEQGFFTDMSDAIKKSGHDPIDWAYNNYLKKDENPKDSTQLTKAFMDDMNKIFGPDLGPTGYSEELDRHIYPTVTSMAEPGKSQFIIPATMLRKWDSKHALPYKDGNASYVPGTVLFELDRIRCIDNKVMEIEGFKNPCMDTMEISETGIIFNSTDVTAISNPGELEDFIQFNNPYDSCFSVYNNESSHSYSGIYWNEAHLTMPVDTAIPHPIKRDSGDGPARYATPPKLAYIHPQKSHLWVSGKHTIGEMTFKVKETKEGICYMEQDSHPFKFYLYPIEELLHRRKSTRVIVSKKPVNDGYEEVTILFTINN